MSNEVCPNGRPECDFPETHELALAGSLLRMIENYTKEHATYPCPKCLRNSMMAMAALLHLEALRAEEAPLRDARFIEPGLVESFVEAARERLVFVMEATVADMLGKKRLM
jgi:hypothetical protein